MDKIKLVRKIRKFLTIYFTVQSDCVEKTHYRYYGGNRLYYVQAFVDYSNPDDTTWKLEIILARKSTFDRWANSKNFQINCWAEDIDEYDLSQALRQTNAIFKHSGIDFNQYFHTIQLDAKYK